MKLGRKGVIDLPVKLIVIFLVLSISVPLIAKAVEQNEHDVSESALNREMGKIVDAAAVVYYSGENTSRTVSVVIPSGCEMYFSATSPESHSIRSSINGSVGPTMYMERPNIGLSGDITLYQGEHLLNLVFLKDDSGNHIIRVTEL